MRKLLRALVSIMFLVAMIGASMHVHEPSALSSPLATCKTCQLTATPTVPGVAPCMPVPHVSEPEIELPHYVVTVFPFHVLDDAPSRSPPV